MSSNELGKLGENKFKEYCDKIANITAYEDVSGKPKYWEQDIDFIITLDDGTTKTIEVKADTRVGYTGNLFIEYENSHPLGGWYNFTKADELYYYDTFNNFFYRMKLKDLRDWIEANKPRSASACGKSEWSRGYLVPVKDCSFIVCVRMSLI